MGKRQLLNVVPNFAGVGAGLLFPLLFNIVYYRLLGTEGYGLVGFYALLAIIASLMDLGLSQTTLREVARRASDHDRFGELQSLVLTLTLISCGLGSLLGLLAIASSKWLATSWLGLSRLSVEEVSTAIATMCGIVALVFPANILNAALRGLQRQVLFNTIAIVAGVCRGVATIAALYIFGSTPLVFFSAQLLISVCEVVLLGVVVSVLLPAPASPSWFDFRLFQASWRFTFTLWLSTVIGQLVLLSDLAAGAATLPVMTIMTHRVVLEGQAWGWFKRAILLPALAAAAVLAPGAILAPKPSPVATPLWLVVNYTLALAAALLCAFGGKLPDLDPPRPNVTNGPSTAPPGSPRSPGKK